MTGDTKHLDYIDALRGYAILGVIAVHASIAVPDLEWPLRLVAEQGARGVQLFFVVSALTLMLSWQQRNDGVLPFYVRRLFRIAPMFWLAMAFFVGMQLSGLPIRYWPPPAISWSNILATATFTHGLHPQTIDSIVPGGWSVADEMIFYLLLPLLVVTLRSWTTTIFALLAAACLSMVMAALAHFGWLFAGLDRATVEQFVFLSFPNQFPAFLAGILVFHLLQAIPGPVAGGALRAGLAASAVAIFAIPFAALVLHQSLPHTVYLLPMVYTLPFALSTWCLAKGGGVMLVNRVIRHIGKVSYSAYFWHFPVLGLVAHFGLLSPGSGPAWLRFLAIFAAGVALSIGVSTITYRLVEAPMIGVGRQLAMSMAAKRVAVPG
ncbi:MAG TPA: acyltransferase [Xanthobacteraceae bacterium]